MTATSFSSVEVERVYMRARKLCQQVDEPTEVFPALWGVWLFYQNGPERQIARELGEQLLSLAQRVHNPAFLVEAHHAWWSSTFLHGELLLVHEHVEQALALYSAEEHHRLTFLYGGHDPGVCCRDFGALALWLLGYPDRAHQRSQEAVALAQKLAHPFSLAEALGYAGWLAELRRDAPAVQEHAAAVRVLATEQGFPYWRAQGTVLQGWVLAMYRQGEEGIAQMRQGIEALRTIRSEWQQPYYLALLAEAYGKGGQAEEGLRVLAEAQEVVGKRGSHFYGAELYRLKGQLVLQSRSSQSAASNTQHLTPNTQAEAEREAEEYFHKAIEIARRQQAKSLELRATVSLVRLRQQQATQYTSRNTHHAARTRLDAARNTLSKIYSWFTEGFDTKDLREAKGLLEELSE
jgi:adenylate cyclase